MTGKDKSGKFHPPKGKPSGSPKKANENLTREEIINESRVSDEAMENTLIRHVNRDISKTPEEKAEGGKE